MILTSDKSSSVITDNKYNFETSMISSFLGSLKSVSYTHLMETLSVIIQVTSFKLRGKRVFKMAPIHHHFEMLGWSEQQVTISFWFIGFICGILAIVIGVL